MSHRVNALRRSNRVKSDFLLRATMEVLEARQLLSAVVVAPGATVPRSDTPQAAQPGKSFYVQGSASQWDQSSSVTPYITNDLLLNTTPTDTDYAACCEANNGDAFGAGPMPQINVFTNGTTQSMSDTGTVSQAASDPSSATNVLAETGNGDTANNAGMPIWHATYTLGSAAGNTPNPNGYTLNEIDVIAGHQDNRTQLGIDVEVSTDGTNFTSLSGGNDFVFTTDGSGTALAKGGSQLAIVSGTAGQPIATGIKAIRFDNIQPPGTPNGTWFRELVITGTPTGVTNPTPPTAPGTPTITGAGVVTFMDNSTNESGFEVQKGSTNAGPWNTIALLPPNSGTGSISYTDVSTTGGTFYRIVAHSAGLGDSISGVGVLPVSTPAQVKGLTVVRTGATSVSLNWGGVFGANTYDVKRGTALNADGTLGGTITDLTPGGVAATSFIDSNAPAGNIFYYQVTASNPAGTGPGSAIVGDRGLEGFVASFYTSDAIDTYPFDGDSVSTAEQFSPDGKTDEAAMPTGTAVLGYQELFSKPINFSGNDGTAPTDAPPGFNSIQGGNGPGHQFAVRFSGIFTPLVTGYYTLGPSTDDGGAATWANVDANGNPVNPVTLTPVGLTFPADHLTTLRGNTLDVDPVVDANNMPVQWIAGNHYYIQFDMQNNGGGWDYHFYDAISSTTANQAAADTGMAAFDIQGQALISPGDVSPPVPTFKTIDAANLGGLAKDAPYYAGSATAGSGAIQLDFNNIAADSYNIYRSTTGVDGSYTKINTAPIPAKPGDISYVDTGLTNGTKYFYIITGVNSVGETTQANGLHLSVTPQAAPPGAPTLSSLTLRSVTNVGTPQTFNVVVNWQALPLTTSYNVLRSTTKGGPYTSLATGITGLTYTDPTANKGTTYYYVVQAVNSIGAGANSNELSITLAPNTGLPNVANAATEHFYDNEYWGSNDQSTTGYTTPRLLGDTTTAPFIDTAGSSTIDLAGNDAAASDLPPNGDIKDNFSVIFSGKIKTDAAGAYTFHANTDDDGYLVVDGQIVSNNANLHGNQDSTNFPITLAANTSYDFQFYMSNRGGGWAWHMYWNEPNNAALTVVPVATASAGGIVASTESVPADPAAGSATASGKNITVTWTDNAVSELEYVLQRSTDPTFATNTTTMVLPFVENMGGAAAMGTFTDSNLASGTYYYRISADNFDGTSKVVPLGNATIGGPLAADFNGDGKVDFSDLLILAQNYGKAADHAHGDANNDGKVGFDDLLILAQTYGKTAAGAPQKDGSLLSSIVSLVKTH